MQCVTTVVVPRPTPVLVKFANLKPSTLYWWVWGGKRTHILMTPPLNFPKLYIAWGILDTNGGGSPLIYEEKCDDLQNNAFSFEEIPEGSSVQLTMVQRARA